MSGRSLRIEHLTTPPPLPHPENICLLYELFLAIKWKYFVCHLFKTFHCYPAARWLLNECLECNKITYEMELERLTYFRVW